ncbi:MAG: glycosyltransferase, partial [Chloroflexota bacterium]
LYGVEDLAHAFVRAAHQHPELRLLILGDGPLAPSIRSIFQQGGVVDRVYFPGQVASQDLPGYYQAADLYISTSHSDGTSISLLEALACGTPVLLTDIPGNQEWITNPGEAGWLFRDGDVDALVKGIEFALDQRDQLPGMGEKARQLAESRADWGKNFPKLFEAYKLH